MTPETDKTPLFLNTMRAYFVQATSWAAGFDETVYDSSFDSAREPFSLIGQITAVKAISRELREFRTALHEFLDMELANRNPASLPTSREQFENALCKNHYSGAVGSDERDTQMLRVKTTAGLPDMSNEKVLLLTHSYFALKFCERVLTHNHLPMTPPRSGQEV